MQPLRKLETLDVPEVVALYLCAVSRGETTSDEMCGLLSCSVTSTVGLALIRARKCLGAMFKRPRGVLLWCSHLTAPRTMLRHLQRESSQQDLWVHVYDGRRTETKQRYIGYELFRFLSYPIF